MGIGICDKCIKKYYPKRKGQGILTGGWTCAKCGYFPARGYYGVELDEFEGKYRDFVTWLKIHRRSMGKRKGKR